MAEQQKKKQSDKKKKPQNQSYELRAKRPHAVLQRIIQSSGYDEAERYAKKFGLVRELNWLVSNMGWIRRKMIALSAGRWPTRLLVGRAAIRRMIRDQKTSAAQYLAQPYLRAAVYDEALAMDKEFVPQVAPAPMAKPKAKAKVAAKRKVALKSKSRTRKK